MLVLCHKLHILLGLYDRQNFPGDRGPSSETDAPTVPQSGGARTGPGFLTPKVWMKFKLDYRNRDVNTRGKDCAT